MLLSTLKTFTLSIVLSNSFKDICIYITNFDYFLPNNC